MNVREDSTRKRIMSYAGKLLDEMLSSGKSKPYNKTLANLEGPGRKETTKSRNQKTRNRQTMKTKNTVWR